MINASIGYMDKLKNPVFALLLSVICAFLARSGFTLDSSFSVYVVIQLYANCSAEFALLALCVMLADVSSVFQIYT